MIGTGEIILILIIVLVLFGPGKLPEIGRMFGSALKEIRRISSNAVNNIGEECSSSPIDSAEQPEEKNT
jgi:sec-independent protein translocase protein TatA